MSEYIVQADFLDDLIGGLKGTEYQHLATEITKKMIDETIPLVRCKDCKFHTGWNECSYFIPDEGGLPIFMREDDFCSCGVRKEKKLKLPTLRRKDGRRGG